MGAFCLLQVYVVKLESFWNPSCKGAWEIQFLAFWTLQHRKAYWEEVGINLEQANYSIWYRCVSLPGLIRYNWEI